MRVLVRFAGSAAAVAATSLVVWALRPLAPTLSLGVLYTLPVLGIAVVWGLGLAVAAAVASMLAFNFFFLPPVNTLTLADGRNWTALAVYVGTAMVTSELAARARRRAELAEQREREAALLAEAAARLMRSQHADEVRAYAASVLRALDDRARDRFSAAFDSLVAMSEHARAAETLRLSDTIKTAVLQSVSHDFRTPLATIGAAVSGLEDGALHLSGDDRAELLETIRLETDRLARLVANLLDLSRLQAGAAVPHRELWAADDLLAQAAAEATQPDRVRLLPSRDLPAAHVDAAQLQRVLVNLIENALRYSEGDVELRTADAGDSVVLEVLDRGPGLTVQGATGTGLGLAIASGFAAANGGSLELEPRAGGGTCARVRLPSQEVPAAVGA
jgi:two-component system sensor histidine kinase KdpD